MMMKRIVSLLLALSMLFGMTGTALAADVVPHMYDKPIDLTLNETELHLVKGDEIQLTYTLTEDLDPSDITWTSSDDSIATVDENGMVRGIKCGDVEITAQAGTSAEKCTVHVVGLIYSWENGTRKWPIINPIKRMMVNGGEVVSVDNSKPLYPVVYLDKAQTALDAELKVYLELSADGGKDRPTSYYADGLLIMDKVTINNYEGTNMHTVSLQNGVGYEEIYGTTVGHNNYTWQIRYLSVLLTLDKDELVLNIGERAVLGATVEGIDSPVVLWESSDESVATVDEDGNVTAVGTGVTVISAIESESGYTRTCEITVGEPTTLQLDKTELTMERGSSETLVASFSGTAPEDAEFVWSSSDESIVTVEDGVVTALHTGEAVVTVNCGEYEASCVVTVTGSAIVDVITINRDFLILGKDQSAELIAAISGEIAENPSFTWTSSDRSIARVVDGVVTGFDYGTTTITVSYGDYEAYCEVAVAPVLYADEELTIVLQEPEGENTVLFVDDGDEMNPVAYLNFAFDGTEDIPELKCLGVENADIGEVVFEAGEAKQTVTVGEQVWAITYKTSALILESKELNLVEGHGAPIKIYNNGTDDDSITWKSSDESVAVVYDGVVTGVGAGTATITIQAGDYEEVCTVNVTANTNTAGIYTVETSAGNVAAKPGGMISVPFVIDSHDLPELKQTCIFFVKTDYAGLVYKGITISEAAQEYHITASVDHNGVAENQHKVYVGSSMPIYSLPEGVLFYMNFEVSEDAKSGVYNYHLNPVQFRSTDVNVAGNYRDYITAINNNLNCIETSGNVIITSGEEEIHAFAQFSFEDTSCRGDENAVVSVNISHDVEKMVSSVQLVPQYKASAMTLIGAEAGSELLDAEVTLNNGIVTIANESGFTLPQGDIMKLTFKLAENVKDGTYSVGIDTTDQVNNHIVDVDGSSGYGIAQFSGLIEVTNYYIVTLTSSENGEISSDKNEAVEGETITLTAQAKEGYRLTRFMVTDAEGNAVTVTNNTFVMPASAVTVRAEFVEQKTMDIKFSVIGGTRPYYAIQFGNFYGVPSENYGEYNGAEYMYWVYPEDRTVPEGSTILEVVHAALDEHDIEYGSGSNYWVKAPKALADVRGGWILQNEAFNATTDPTTVIGPNAAWCVTILRDGKYLEYIDTAYVTDIDQLGKFGLEEVLPGDEVIFHFSYDQFFEPLSSQGVKLHHDDYKQQYLKVKDFTPEQIAKIWTVEDLIDAIGTVNRSSEERIIAAENAYDALKKVEQGEVENYSVLKEARKRYDKLVENNLMSPPMLKAEDAVEVSDKETMKSTITLAAPSASVDDNAAGVQYRTSSNKGASWSDWQDSPVFEGLKAGSTYYFQAQYVGSEKYGNSGEGNTIKVIAPFVVHNRNEWLEAFSAAPTDGTRTIIQIAGDVEIGVTGAYTTRTPIGANIIMIGDGGMLKSPGGGMTNNGFAVAENAIVTLKNLTYESIGPVGATQYGAENANFGSMIYFEGKNGTVNLDNVVMYGDCSETGEIITCNASNCTLNIYSATIDSISADSQTPGAGKISDGSGLIINLLPTGNIAMEGSIGDPVRLIPQKDYKINGAALERSTHRAYDSLETELEAMNMATEATPYVFKSNGGGLRVIVDDSPAIPKKLTAPKVNVDDLIIEYGKVTVPSDLVSKEQPQAILQYRIMAYKGDTLGWGVTAALGKWRCPPMTFTSGLHEDTEYRLEIRFNSIDSTYANSDTTVVHFRTGYHTTQLNAPHLTNEAQQRTDSSITLVQPVASTQDTGATFEYRVSENPEYWEDAQWQKELVFDDLAFGTTYYFQARYVADHYLWENSEGSEAVEISTKAKVMASPILKETASTTIDSITLTKPVASEEDADAAIQYRISDDGVYWYQDWQDAAVFEGLESNTDYYFQARYVPQNNRYLPSEGSNVVKVLTAVDENKTGFVVTGGTARKGDTVEVIVSVRNNPGIMSAVLEVDYDSTKLELQDVYYGVVFNANDTVDSDLGANPYKLYFKNADNVTTNGTMAKLVFKVKEDAAVGESEITLSYKPNNVFNQELDNVAFDVVNGSVTIVETVMGDVNGDGVTDGKDLTTLYRYLAGWVCYELDEMDLAVADITGDGQVNAKDASYLQRALAGWDGYSLN